MESTAGGVSHCKYESGECSLSNGQFLKWEVEKKASCAVIPWKTIKGTAIGNTWVSEDSQLALVDNEKRMKDCKGNTLEMTVQGIPYEKVKHERKRSVEHLPELGVVTSQQLAASLQAMQIQVKSSVSFAFKRVASGICRNMQVMENLMRAFITSNPTIAMRAILNEPATITEAQGNAVIVRPCLEIYNFTFLPMNATCTNEIPIRFFVEQERKGYFDPVTNEVHAESKETNCVKDDYHIINLQDQQYKYDKRTGNTSVIDLPKLSVDEWNVNSTVSTPEILYEPIVMYKMEEIATNSFIKDLAEAWQNHRKQLSELGVSDDWETQEERPWKPRSLAKSGMNHIGSAMMPETMLYVMYTIIAILLMMILRKFWKCLKSQKVLALIFGGMIAGLANQNQAEAAEIRHIRVCKNSTQEYARRNDSRRAINTFGETKNHDAIG